MSFNISPSNEYSGLISFRIDWFDLLAVHGTLKSPLQHYSSKASILQHSAFFMVSSAYLRLLVYLQAVMIPACASSSPVFHMMYSACKLNKQRDHLQPLYTPLPALNQSVVSCPVLTVASCPLFRFLRRQVRWSDIPVSLRIFQFVVICTIKMALVQSMKQMFFGIPLLFL